MSQILQELTERFTIQAVVDQAIAAAPDVVAALVVLVVFWALTWVTRPPLRAALRRADFSPALVRLLVDSVYRIALLAVAVVMAAGQLGVNVTAALAGFGVAGIAVGLAAQDSLANTIAGFLIFWDKPFKVGDTISVAGKYGEVRNITLRTTRIRTRNNTYVVIPNQGIIDDVLENHSMFGETRVDVPVGIAYKEDIREARKVLLAALDAVEGVLDDPAPRVVVVSLGDSSIDLEVRVWVADAGEEKPAFVETVEACKFALDEAGIEIPFPHRQLFIERFDRPDWLEAVRRDPAA